MTTDLNTTLLIAVTFAFVIAFIFSMFGQGGGSVYSPLLILLGYSILLSTSTSLALNLITSLSAGYIFYRKKLIDYKTSFIFAPGISLGAFAGGALSHTFIGARMIYSYWEKEKVEENPPEKFSVGMYALIALFGAGVGFLAGLLGLAAGFSSFHSWSTSANTPPRWPPALRT